MYPPTVLVVTALAPQSAYMDPMEDHMALTAALKVYPPLNAAGVVLAVTPLEVPLALLAPNTAQLTSPEEFQLVP